VIPILSILAFTFLIFILGAAVMHFRLFGAENLRKAFIGGQAWLEHGRDDPSWNDTEEAGPTGVLLDKADKTYDGFTLFTTGRGTWARLIDMNGDEVHQWQMPFRRARQGMESDKPVASEDRLHWFRSYLYPNGDLLAVYHAVGETPYGYGLVKLDKYSRVLWFYPENVHHDVDVGEDGTIYTLTQKLARTLPDELGPIPTPCIAESLLVLTSEGKKVKSIPILEAFHKSPYALTLSLLDRPIPEDRLPRVSRFAPLLPSPPAQDRPKPGGGTSDDRAKGDITHANSVKVLRRAHADKFPLFKPGQVLISLRNLDTLAVLDPESGSVVWAARGLWRSQHDAEWLSNGHLLVYDNLGSPEGTRIIEYDPLTQAVPWSYASEGAEPFIARVMGTKQRLRNENTLIVDPGRRRIFEVTHSKECVWEYLCPPSFPMEGGRSIFARGPISGARRYGANELTFLKGEARARP
jgi:hypothetical protein